MKTTESGGAELSCQVLFLLPETARVPHLCWLSRRNWCLLSATIRPPILVQPSSPRVKPISARLSSSCPDWTPKVCHRIEGTRSLIDDRRHANAREEQVLQGLAGSLIARFKASLFHTKHRSMLTDVCKAVKSYPLSLERTCTVPQAGSKFP